MTFIRVVIFSSDQAKQDDNIQSQQTVQTIRKNCIEEIFNKKS